jgi:hypothetical protein
MYFLGNFNHNQPKIKKKNKPNTIIKIIKI